MNSKPKSNASHARRQSGLSLIEVLIAVLILGVGMLGIAALQAVALKNNQSSMARSQAVFQTYGMLDAMRANLDVARNNGYNLAKTCTAFTGTTLVTRDQAMWINALHQSIGGSGTTCGAINCANRVCTITVTWNDERGTGGDAAQTLTTVSRL